MPRMSREIYTEEMRQTDLVFVYGTLQNLEWGPHPYLSYSEFIGDDVTRRKFVLGRVGFPYAFPREVVPRRFKKVLLPVEGQVFRMYDEEVFANLDGMEGYPRHYDRMIIHTKGGHKCWMYVQMDWDRSRYCSLCTVTEEGNWKW